MTQLYPHSTIGRWRLLGLVGLVSLSWTAQAQQHPAVTRQNQALELSAPPVAKRITALPYTSGRGQNVTGTYTDLGTTGSVIATANLDNANSSAQDIGFPFSYNGTTFTQFTLNTNGFIKLGATPAAAADDILVLINNTDQNVIGPATGVDLVGAADQTASPTEFRVSTTGAVGSRVCTIQFKNLSDKPVTGANPIPSQFRTMQFQVKLYEGTNNVEFVYGTWTSSGNTAGSQGFLIGLKGSSADPADLSLTSKSGTAAWSSTVFQNTVVQSGVTYYVGHFVQNTALPDAGRTYRFRAAQPNDASVATIHTLGKLAVPNSLPHAVATAVTNNGTNALSNVPVTLTVSGANTFTSTKTITTLAPGATQLVTFDAYPSTLAQGTNNLTVSVPADDDNSNNSLPYTQQVTTDQVAYIDAAQSFYGSVGVSSTTPGGTLAVKYKNSQAASLSQVKVTFTASAGTTSTYRVVVLDATGANGTPGAVLYTSGVQNRPATAGTVTIPVPNPLVSGDFYVGLQEVSGNVGVAYQFEDPLRASTFYYQTAAGAAWNLINATTLRTRMAIDATLAPVPTCFAPTAISVGSVTANSAAVSFTGVSNGTGYTVIYGPRGFNPATSGTSVSAATSPINLTGLTSGVAYDVYIRSNCGATDQSSLSGPTSFTTVCQPPIITTFPYSEGFDGVAAGTLPCGITVTNDNNDNRTWAVVGTDTPGGAPASAPNQLRYVYSSTAAADDWVFTPALFLRAGSTYQLSFKYKAAVLGTSEKLEVKYGTAANAASQTTTLWRNENITNATYTLTTGGSAAGQVLPITPATTGNYYIGFHVFSAADQYNLYLDDIAISTVTASSPAMVRAISLYPNPTAGSLTVEVSGANAKGALQVEVYNTLGQRVHTATVRDNMTNQLDLSKLSNGMYMVKVKNGAEYMMRNISIQK